MSYKDCSFIITGGSGSFGNAFTRYLLEHTEARRVIIYSRDEYKQFIMQQEFAEHMHRLRFFVGDVRDAHRLSKALFGVDYVIHAAAMKQVPACEYNPMEAVNTNIVGAMNVISASLENESVKRVIALSTDKAVSPINLYGGTKLVSDKLFTAANSYSGRRHVRFSVVRYGNVAGSRGSVIPFFKQKIDEGSVLLPLTDENMTRFWMTLDKSVSLVMKAIELSKGGEVFVYKNPSFYVTDLIQAMLGKGAFNVTGIREGEKLHECMITSSDSLRTYEYDDYYVIYPNYDWWTVETGIIPGGKPVEQGWEYTSDKNSWWLSVEDLKKYLPE
jgi:UDP-N-acetylglucosamine 4,6-dehydratase (inverting)